MVDSNKNKLVYLAPEEIQYDPVINDSMTWQIYNGPLYQKPLPDTTGKWTKFSLEVQPNGVTVYLGENPTPQLIVSNLQHGRCVGKIGVWGYLPSYIRNLSIEEIQPSPIIKTTTDYNRLLTESFVTEWMVSNPYIKENASLVKMNWTKAYVEENGTLNINRLYKAERGMSVIAESMFSVAEAKETILTFGYSDILRLWINDQEVYQGEWRWNPPGSDGRIRYIIASVPVRWRAGVNTIRAAITDIESFGCELSVKTGLSDMVFLLEEIK